MATFLGDICFVSGRYTNEQGEEKANWTKVGKLFQSDRGYRILMTDPAHPDGSYWLNVFPPKDNPRPAPQQAPAATQQGQDDDIPF